MEEREEPLITAQDVREANEELMRKVDAEQVAKVIWFAIIVMVIIAALYWLIGDKENARKVKARKAPKQDRDPDPVFTGQTVHDYFSSQNAGA